MTVKRTVKTDPNEEERLVFVRAVPVFDRAQVGVIDGADPRRLTRRASR